MTPTPPHAIVHGWPLALVAVCVIGGVLVSVGAAVWALAALSLGAGLLRLRSSRASTSLAVRGQMADATLLLGFGGALAFLGFVTSLG